MLVTTYISHGPGYSRGSCFVTKLQTSITASSASHLPLIARPGFPFADTHSSNFSGDLLASLVLIKPAILRSRSYSYPSRRLLTHLLGFLTARLTWFQDLTNFGSNRAIRLCVLAYTITRGIKVLILILFKFEPPYDCVAWIKKIRKLTTPWQHALESG